MKNWSTKVEIIGVNRRKDGQLSSSISESLVQGQQTNVRQSRKGSSIRQRRAPLDYRILSVIVTLAVPPLGVAAFFFAQKSQCHAHRDVEYAWHLAHWALAFILLALGCVGLALFIFTAMMINSEVHEYLTQPDDMATTSLPSQHFPYAPFKFTNKGLPDDFFKAFSGDFDDKHFDFSTVASHVSFQDQPVMSKSTNISPANISTTVIGSKFTQYDSNDSDLALLHRNHGSVKREKSSDELLQAENLMSSDKDGLEQEIWLDEGNLFHYNSRSSDNNDNGNVKKPDLLDIIFDHFEEMIEREYEDFEHIQEK